MNLNLTPDELAAVERLENYKVGLPPEHVVNLDDVPSSRVRDLWDVAFALLRSLAEQRDRETPATFEECLAVIGERGGIFINVADSFDVVSLIIEEDTEFEAPTRGQLLDLIAALKINTKGERDARTPELTNTEVADGPRYRMLGNAVNVKHSHWIATRIVAAENQ